MTMTKLAEEEMDADDDDGEPLLPELALEVVEVSGDEIEFLAESVVFG